MMKQQQKKTSGSLSRIRKYFPQVTRITDANHSAIVEVTQYDNDHSEVRNHRTCALALASVRCLHADGAIIGLTTSWVIKGTVAMRFNNAATVSREITSFDRNAGFDPGKYLLAAPTASQKLGIERSRNPNRSGKKGRGAIFRHFTRNVRASLNVA